MTRLVRPHASKIVRPRLPAIVYATVPRTVDGSRVSDGSGGAPPYPFAARPFAASALAASSRRRGGEKDGEVEGERSLENTEEANRPFSLPLSPFPVSVALSPLEGGSPALSTRSRLASTCSRERGFSSCSPAVLDTMCFSCGGSSAAARSVTLRCAWSAALAPVGERPSRTLRSRSSKDAILTSRA